MSAGRNFPACQPDSPRYRIVMKVVLLLILLALKYCWSSTWRDGAWHTSGRFEDDAMRAHGPRQCSTGEWQSGFKTGGTLPLHCCGTVVGPIRGWYDRLGPLHECGVGVECTRTTCARMAASGWAPGGYLSQFAQDQWLHRAVFRDKPGVFVELGGYDAVMASNTWFFERCQGWRGLVVEPQRSRHAGFERLRPNATLEKVCVSDVEGEEVDFTTTVGGSGLAGITSESVLSAIERLDSKAVVKHEVMHCATLATLFRRHGIRHVDYLSLDCEGCELKAVRSIDFKEVTIDVMTIERSKSGVEAVSYLLAQAAGGDGLGGAKYIHVGNLGADALLVRADLRLPCPDLGEDPTKIIPKLERFKKLPNFVDAQDLYVKAAANGSGHDPDPVIRAAELTFPPVAEAQIIDLRLSRLRSSSSHGEDMRKERVTAPLDLVLLLLDDASPDMFPDAFPNLVGDAAWRAARYGTPLTPHVAQLARDGVTFTTAWSPAICAPARTSILTGRYPSDTGHLHNTLFLATPERAASYALLPALLRKAGYVTALAGKWGIGPTAHGIPGDLASANFSTYLVHVPGRNQHNERVCDNSTVDTTLVNPLATTTYLSRYWAPCYQLFPYPPGTKGYVATSRADYGPELEANFVRDFLAQIRDDKKETPFFLYYPTVLVHETEARTLPSTPLRGVVGDNGAPPKHNRLAPDGEWIARMRALIEYTDSIVGRLLAELSRPGVRQLSDRAVVWLASDNAAAYTGKGRGVERGASVLSIVSGTGIKRRGTVDAFHDSTSFFPTFLEFAGVTSLSDEHHRHRSLAAYVSGQSEKPPFDWIATEVGGTRLIRTRSSLLEAANALLGVNAGRLYATPFAEPMNGSCYVRCFGGDSAFSMHSTLPTYSSMCAEAHNLTMRAWTSMPPHIEPTHPFFATTNGRKFLEFHRAEATEHLVSHPWYAGKDESADDSCGSLEATAVSKSLYCPADNRQGNPVEFYSHRLKRTIYGLPPEEQQRHSLVIMVVASPRVGSTFLVNELNKHPRVVMHNELFHWDAHQFSPCFGNGTYSHINHRAVNRCPPSAIFKARHTDPRLLLRWLLAQSPDTSAVGFKLMPGHVVGVNNVGEPRPWLLADALYASMAPPRGGPTPHILALVVKRACQVAQFLSLERAIQTDTWGSSTAPATALHVDPNKLSGFVAGLAHYHSTVDSVLENLRRRKNIRVDTITLTYEADLGTPTRAAATLEHVYKLAGLATPVTPVQSQQTDSGGHQSKPPRHASLESLVTNFAQLPASLTASCTSHEALR